MASAKRISVVVVALAVITMAIPVLGVSPMGGSQAPADTDSQAAASQEDTQATTSQQATTSTTAESTTEQESTETSTEQEGAETSTEQSSDQTAAEQSGSDTTTDTSSGAEDRSLLNVYQEAQTSYEQTEDVNATVAASTSISSDSVEQTYNATLDLSYEQPNKFRFELLEPEAQAGTVIVSNGTTTAFYDSTSNTVSTVAMADVLGQNVSQAAVMEQAGSTGQIQSGAGTVAMGVNEMNLTGMEDPSQLLQSSNVSYEGTETVNGYETDVLSIENANESLGYDSSTTIYLDQETSVPVKIVSSNTITSNGETTTINATIEVTDLAVNEGIPDSVFELDAPEDAERIGVDPTTPDEATYYQVDLVAGEPIENLRGPEGTYTSDELIRFAHGSTEDPITRRSEGEFTTDENLADRIESQNITVEDGTATTTFTVTEGEPVELTLASYEKTGPGWSPETESEQEFIDSQTETFSPGTHTLTVDLPGDETDSTDDSE